MDDSKKDFDKPLRRDLSLEFVDSINYILEERRKKYLDGSDENYEPTL